MVFGEGKGGDGTRGMERGGVLVIYSGSIYIGIIQILEGNTNSIQRESNRRTIPKTLTPTEEQQQKDIKYKLKELLIPLILQLIKLVTATDLSTKIEAMIEIAKIFVVQGIIKKNL